VLTTYLDRATARAAIAAANRAPSLHNAQPWRWRIGESSIHLLADPGRALPATDPSGRDLRISCGAALHHLRVALQAIGFDAHVHRLPDPAVPDHLAAVEPISRTPTDDDLALAAAIDRRRSDRRMFSTWPVDAGLLEELRQLAACEGAALRILDGDDERRAVARLVEQAAVEQAGSAELAQETATWTGRSRVAREGVPAAAVPADPQGVVPVRQFAAGELDQIELGREESDGTVLTLLATTGDNPIDQLRAGEALSAVLLTAARIGLATDPISQPLEVPGTRAQLRASCLKDELEPQIIVRLGWAPISAPPLPVTRRRPVDETIEELARPWP
jgi:nitroreductase